MFRSLIAALGWALGFGPDVPSVTRLRAERAAAFDAFVQARRAQDTRRQHETRQALARATSALLRSELAEKRHRSAKPFTGAIGSR